MPRLGWPVLVQLEAVILFCFDFSITSTNCYYGFETSVRLPCDPSWRHWTRNNIGDLWASCCISLPIFQQGTVCPPCEWQGWVTISLVLMITFINYCFPSFTRFVITCSSYLCFLLLLFIYCFYSLSVFLYWCFISRVFYLHFSPTQHH